VVARPTEILWAMVKEGMAAVSPLPAFKEEVSQPWRFSPSFSGHQDAPMQHSAVPASWSNPCSPDFHRECNQVYETLGSLQKALSLSGDVRITEEAHRQEADSLWRENRELRSEVRVWQDEAKTLQHKNAELQLQVAQLLAELDAERAMRASAGLAPALNVSATPRAGANSGYGLQATPVRDLERARSGFAEGAVAAAATPMRRRSSTRGSGSGGLTGAEEAELSSRHADELVALSARHAGEVAELHVRHAHCLEMLQGEADFARSTAGVAERRCRLAERSALRAQAASVSLSLEATHLTGQMMCFAAWRYVTTQAMMRSSSRTARVLAAGEAFRMGQEELAKCYCWLIWLSAIREACEKRDLRALEVELLRSRYLRHAQLSWFSSLRATAEAMLSMNEAFLSWRTHVAVLLRGIYGSKLNELQSRYGSARSGLDRLSASTYVQKLARSVAAAWHCEARVLRMAHLKDQAAQALDVRLGQIERQAVGLRERLALEYERSLMQKAWLALWLAVHVRALDDQEEATRAESARAEEAQALAERLDFVTIRALQTCLRYQESLEARGVLEAWSAIVDANRWGRTVQVLEARLAVLRRRGPEVLLNCVVWGYSKVLLHRAFDGWLRLLQRGPGALGDAAGGGVGRLDLELKLQAMHELSRSQKQALLQTMITLLEAAQAFQLVFSIWSSWQKARHEAQRFHRENRLSLQDSRRRQSMDQVHALLFGSASRVQAGFILRACWAMWRRLRAVQRMVTGGEEISRLRASHHYLEHSRSSQVQHFSERLWQQHVAAVAYVAWTAWRRRQREGEMLSELEKLQQLLLVFHSECQRQQEYDHVDAWMETQTAMVVVGGMGEGVDPGSPRNERLLQQSQARPSPPSVPELSGMHRLRSRSQGALRRSSSPLPQPHHPLPQEPLRPAAWPIASPRCR